MNTISTLGSARAGKRNWWQWLLRSTGLESWFQRVPAVAHAGQQEHILLLLALASSTVPSTLLADALRACAPAFAASGGEVVSYRPGTLLLAWPTGAGQPLPPVATLYFQVRACAQRLAGPAALSLGGAAGLSWAAPGAAARHYDQASLGEVAGILHESQQMGSQLLLSAALHDRLAPLVAEHCTLHVAFKVPGHRYPATLYQVVAPAGS
ncbi:MAG: hypothetical protein EOO36_01235 [Cytophagaceae bacterium]|nr:MAG: hypothetical protein EOO36_01235 [Cytophagaceae bacterium]